MTSDSDSPFDALLREAAELRASVSYPVLIPAPGDLLQEKYRIEEKLDKGGMGAVFRATHVESGKPVAIKWLLGGSQQAAQRFLREAQITAQIDHPNVVNVFDVGSHRGGRFLVMELLRGESLGARIRRTRLSAQELLAIMVPVLRGVAAAHREAVVHRDLKPDNVFLCIGPDGCGREPKVLDFGISKLRSAPVLEERLTAPGTGLGTIAYMSPEQLVDAPNVDERTDIYAAGVMMYEALTGRLPFRADSHNALVLAIAAQRPLPISTLIDGVPPALEEIILRAMAKDALRRQPDVPTLIGELEACLSIDPNNPAQRPEQIARATRRRRQRLAFAICASLPLAIALWFATHPPEARPMIRYASRPEALFSAGWAAPPTASEMLSASAEGSTQPAMSQLPVVLDWPQTSEPVKAPSHPPIQRERLPAPSPAGNIDRSDL